jgi:hypothetical protein
MTGREREIEREEAGFIKGVDPLRAKKLNRSKVYSAPSIPKAGCVKIHDDINRNRARHSRESGNPERHWIPGQARNDKRQKIYVVVYRIQAHEDRCSN